MNPKLIMASVLIFIFGNAFCIIWGMQWYGSFEDSVMMSLTGYTVMQVSGVGVWTVMKLGSGFLFTGLPTLLAWNYPFLHDNIFGWFIWMILMAVSCGVYYGLYQMFAPIVQGVFGWVRSLF